MLNAILSATEYLLYFNLMFYILHMYLLFSISKQNLKKWKEKNKLYLFSNTVRKKYEMKKYSNTKAKTLINKTPIFNLTAHNF